MMTHWEDADKSRHHPQDFGSMSEKNRRIFMDGNRAGAHSTRSLNEIMEEIMSGDRKHIDDYPRTPRGCQLLRKDLWRTFLDDPKYLPGIRWMPSDNPWSQRMAWFCYGFFTASMVACVIWALV